MLRCEICGGSCIEIGNGCLMCECCGNVFANPDMGFYSNNISTKKEVTKANELGADIFEKNINGILEITWNDGQNRFSGSGFLISREGYCITNTHVVTSQDGKSCETVSVNMGGESLKASVLVLGDNKHGLGGGVDLALLKLEKVPPKAPVLNLENFDNVRIGEPVYVIGNSLGYGTCITSGIVSDKARNVNGKMLLMTDCAVNGGNSGGPVFNNKGRVIGAIVSGIDRAEGMNFAIPSKTIQEFIIGAKKYCK